jgi:hypothetical protein
MHSEDHHIWTEFLNSDTGTPFDSCMVCQSNVQKSGDDYFIERILRRVVVEEQSLVEPLFEYAICQGCAETLRQEMSSDSMRAIQTFFEAHLPAEPTPEGTDRLSHCLLTGKRIDSCTEFSYHAHCRGNHLIPSLFPYAISDEAMDQIAELLSEETLGFLDDFKGRYFTGPPAYRDLLNPKRLIPL